MAFRLLKRILGLPTGEAARPLLQALVREGRDPAWYRDGGVPDTVDGRFEVQALVTALALLRIETFGKDGAELFRQLAESFAADMEIQVREIGLGEGVMAKHVGRMMSLLGGRITGMRHAETDEQIADWLGRTLHVQADPQPGPAQIAVAVRLVRALRERLEATGLDALEAGQLAS